MSKSQKIINTKLDENLNLKFERIKEKLGIQNDAEVLRFLISNYFNAKFEKSQNLAEKEYQKSIPIIDRFMKEYGDEWNQLGE